MSSTRRILFFAEPATLAHVVRPVFLAATLDRTMYEVAVATGEDFRHHVEAARLPVRPLSCIGTRKYLEAVAAGRPVYSFATLKHYVDDDLRTIEAFSPDVVVGDFRLSLAVSARLARVPYIAISNAYWSPLADVPFDVPVHAATRFLGAGFTNRMFGWLRPLIFAHHCLPMHRLRRHYGMKSLGFNLCSVFTEADITLFADVPELVPVPVAEPQGRYRFIGPITWSPDCRLPESLLHPDSAVPHVYVAMGSSGDDSALDIIVAAVVASGCHAVVAAPKDRWSLTYGDKVTVRPLLPGGRVAALCQLVICNGGSPSVHQALQQGTPVLGIPANLDQMLNMRVIVRSGAGLSVRADQLSVAQVVTCVRKMLSDKAFAAHAAKVQRWFDEYKADRRFDDALRMSADLNV